MLYLRLFEIFLYKLYYFSLLFAHYSYIIFSCRFYYILLFSYQYTDSVHKKLRVKFPVCLDGSNFPIKKRRAPRDVNSFLS